MFTYNVVKGDCVDDAEVVEVVLVRGIIAMPGHHVKGRMILMSDKQVTLKCKKLNFTGLIAQW